MANLVSFPSGQVDYLYGSPVGELWQLYDGKDIVLITDTNLFALYPGLFANRRHVVLPAGENSKSLETINWVVESLIQLEATRSTTLIGIGGGVVTDITGFAASVYMRGIPFGFVPTTLLGMVDAAIGGKNGVNVGLHKNMAGTFNQPAFILYDTGFLGTLPKQEWANGFAETIKYACIFDAALFSELQQHDIAYYRQNAPALNAIIEKCATWKNITVINDEHEKGLRKLLNFGHTAGHAIETLYAIPHGEAVAIGMAIAARLSEDVTSLSPSATLQITKLLEQYNLPTTYPIETTKAMELMKMDKKRTNSSIGYILLDAIGKASVHTLPFGQLEKAMRLCAQ